LIIDIVEAAPKTRVIPAIMGMDESFHPIGRGDKAREPVGALSSPLREDMARARHRP
jgi:hypothetical protein